jgi:hypothetical protein
VKASGSISTLAVAASNTAGISNGNTPRQKLLLIQAKVFEQEELEDITSAHRFIVCLRFLQ